MKRLPLWGTFTGYKVVYIKNGQEICAGTSYIFPIKELAENYKKHWENKSWFNEKLYIKEVEYQRRQLKPLKYYNGKPVYNKDYTCYDALVIGDYVDQEGADAILDAVSPVCMRNDCLQLGEPYSHKIDEETGKIRAVYLTLKKVAEDVWEYCGNCFEGENIERGKEIPLV